MEVRHSDLARKLAAEGMVLLKNEGLLPLAAAGPVALLGSGAIKTVKGGTGSGDVNSKENISIYQGLKEAGVTVVSENWLKDYERRYETAREIWKAKVLEAAKTTENPFDAYAANPFTYPAGRMAAECDVEGAAAAIYVISRIAGEGKDRRREAGDYYLSEQEQADILFLDGRNLPILLIINAGGPIELTDILQSTKNIRAILSISQPGQEGGRAVADVLLGKNAPGGRLTATWAKRYEDYPYGEEYSYLNGNLAKEEYKEGIYVGYRYFDSFGVEPLFPFGYGLAYTSFAMEFLELRVLEKKIEIDVSVKNTGGCYAGKEVVQVYVSLPQGQEAKERRRLAGFAKTDVLLPQETQTVTVVIEQKHFASFSENLQAWYMDAGEYGIWIGRHAGALQMSAVVVVEKQTILERTSAICPRQEMFAEMMAREPAKVSAQPENGLPRFVFVPQEEEKPFYEPQPERELPAQELLPLLYGNVTEGTGNLGSSGTRVPGSAGETTEALEEKYKIRSLIMADGPAGLRLRQSYEVDRQTGSVYGVGVLGTLENGFLEVPSHHENADTVYQLCTAFPVGTALAQMWNPELMKAFGEAVAEEMKKYRVDLWLAPGMNIQRNPLCGRNFEYFSEDPLLSGVMAAAVTAGVQSKAGCGVTIKHFACNNQEDNRMSVDACVSERALREIYLRGFEIAIKKSRPAAVMSSYNLINGVHAANNRDLCTRLARGEWGYDGVIMSDWNTTCPEDGSVPWMCAAAGNDLIMPGNPMDAQNIREAYEQGKLSEEDVRNCAGRILALVRRLDI